MRQQKRFHSANLKIIKWLIALLRASYRIGITNEDLVKSA
jgi:hypothetical protein